MKKMLSLVLALMMLMICPAMAETTVEMQKLTSPDGTYSFEVPQDFLPMNAEVMMTLFANEDVQQMIAQAMGLQDASQLAMYFELLEDNNMMIVYGSDMVSNLNVQAIPTELTMELLVALKAMMDSTTTQQYLQMGVAEEDIHPMEIQQIGSYSWYGMKVLMAGMEIQTMMTIENGVQYVIAFTGMDAAVIEHLLESFKVVAPVAE